MKKILLTFALITTVLFSNAQLTLTTGSTPAALVGTILGTGVTVTNISYTGAANSKGTFTCAGACNLGMTNGIIMSSGVAGGTVAPASNFHSDDMALTGDPTLNSILVGQTTYDACVLEFDFSVASDSVKFDYVFGSEEYNDWVNTSFNDVFGFFISGPGIVGQKNIAIVPGTTTSVSINNVNNGGPYGGVSTGPCTNCTYFVDNINGASVYLDCFTTVLTAKDAVQPCETYHIKLAIADVSDHVYNSDVFIEGGSFSSLGQITLYANGQVVSNNDTVFGCVGGTVTLSLNPAQNYNWSTGASTQSIVVPVNSTPTSYSGYVFNPTNFCFAFTTNIVVVEAPAIATITPNGSLDLCPGGNVMLTANNGNQYLWSNGATGQSITIGTPGTFTVTVTNGPGCSATSTPVTVTVGSATASINGPSALCNGAAANLTANVGLSYVWSTGATSQIISATSTGTYTVTVTQSGGCTASASTTLNINANPIPSISGINTVCQGTPTSFDAGVGYNMYQWSNGNTTQIIVPAISGNYTVTVTDANGCTGTSSYTLTINSNPVPAISGVTAICQGSAASLDAGAGYSIYQWSSGASNQVINPIASGTFSVTVTSATGCTGSVSQVVNVNALPTPVISGVTAVCQGAAANLDAGIGYAAYLWNTGVSSQSINPTSSGVFTVTVTDANGCTGSTTVNVAVANNPTPNITGVNTICQGTPTTFDGGAGYTVYSWSTGSSSQTINPTISGPYTVTVTNASGCTGTTSYDLIVNALPVPTVTGTTAICAGTNSVFDGGSGYSNYAWSSGAISQTISINTSGIYTVTVTDLNGCTGSSSLTLLVNALPTPAITGLMTVCDGVVANLDAGAGYSIYQWTSGSTGQVINPIASGIFTVTVTNLNGCTATTSATVVVNSNPTPTVTGTNIICQGTPTTFDGGAGYANYNWSNGANAQTINPNSTGVYTVTVTDLNGCTGTSSLALTVNANPTPMVTGINSICQGLATVFDAGFGFSNYQWSNGNSSQTININASGIFTITVTDGSGCTGTSSLQLTVNPLPVPNINGDPSICDGNNSLLDGGAGYASYVWANGNSVQTYSTNIAGTYTVTVTDLNGCTGSASFSLVVNQNPTPVITGINSICDGYTSNLDAGSFVSYQWSNGLNTQVIAATNAGNYSVIVTDANGCTGVSPLFNLSVLFATATITPAGPLDFCKGGSVALSANSGMSYLWSDGSTSQTIVSTITSVYTVVVVNNNGCTATSASIQVGAHENPIASFTYDSSEICNALRITFINNSTFDPGSTFYWDLGDGNTATFINPIHDYKVQGDYKVILYVSTPWGCKDSISTMVHVEFAPEAIPFFTAEPDLQNVFSSTIVFTDKSINAYSWFWEFGDGRTSTLQHPVHQFDAAGTYKVKLTVTNKNNCEEVYKSEVNIAPFWIPNAFTPNSDGKNDVFFDASYTLAIHAYHMTIFNRWGEAIFVTDSYSKPWTGMDANGKPAQSDTYVYMIKVTTNSGVTYTFRGVVDLIR